MKTSMVFWTDEVSDDTVQAPVEILKAASDELMERSRKLCVELKRFETSDRICIVFQVSNKNTGTVVDLFKMLCLNEDQYPVLLEPPTDDTPDFLKRKRTVKGTAPLGKLYYGVHPSAIKAIAEGVPDKVVDNPWVCASPSELEEKLKKLLSMDAVKTKVFSLMSQIAPTGHSGTVTELPKSAPDQDSSEESG